MTRVLAISLVALLPLFASAQTPAPRLSAVSHGAPRSSGASRLYAKAQKEMEQHKYDMAFEDFRKADQQDNQQCADCEIGAYNAAETLSDYKAAREETALLLEHVSSPEDKAKEKVCSRHAAAFPYL